jgi:2,4-dienoyl-CoA reductase-like NADH-dependent reductase (Old Yellow Enzyme family)
MVAGVKLLNSNTGDAISFGKLAISNPDLPERFRNGWEVV